MNRFCFGLSLLLLTFGCSNHELGESSLLFQENFSLGNLIDRGYDLVQEGSNSGFSSSEIGVLDFFSGRRLKNMNYLRLVNGDTTSIVFFVGEEETISHHIYIKYSSLEDLNSAFNSDYLRKLDFIVTDSLNSDPKNSLIINDQKLNKFRIVQRDSSILSLLIWNPV